MQTLPHSTVEQREHLYGDVESLISPGFLSNIVTIGSSRLVLRSLGPGDLFMLQMRAGLHATEWKLWSVASSIWMVDGHCVLGQDWVVPRMVRWLKAMPPITLNILFSQVLGLFARIRASMRALEAYMFENTSRYSWKTIGPDPRLNSGVPGAEKLGLNSIQRMWVAYNEMEDRRIHQEGLWEGFKLTAMGTAPKGVKKLDEADTRKREEEETRRQAILDRFYYWKAGVIPETVFEQGRMVGSMVNGAKSVDDLETEMKQWVSGERDDHDLIVAQYKQKISNRMKDEEAARMQRLRDLEAKREELMEEQETLPTQLVAYTPDQLQRVLAERGHGGSGARFIGPERNDQRFLYDRYLKAEETTSGLQVVNGRIVHPNADPETDARTLNQLIKGRKVQMGEGD